MTKKWDKAEVDKIINGIADFADKHPKWREAFVAPE